MWVLTRIKGLNVLKYSSSLTSFHSPSSYSDSASIATSLILEGICFSNDLKIVDPSHQFGIIESATSTHPWYVAGDISVKSWLPNTNRFRDQLRWWTGRFSPWSQIAALHHHHQLSTRCGVFRFRRIPVVSPTPGATSSFCYLRMCVAQQPAVSPRCSNVHILASFPTSPFCSTSIIWLFDLLASSHIFFSTSICFRPFSSLQPDAAGNPQHPSSTVHTPTVHLRRPASCTISWYFVLFRSLDIWI